MPAADGRRRSNSSRAPKPGGRGAPMRRCICGPRAKPPEAFSVDRLQTPIGPALVVTDASGMLRAFDWEDHAARIKELLRLQYGAVELKEARMPAALRTALS